MFILSRFRANYNLFREFTGQNGKGAIGPSNFEDTSGVTWSIDISSASLTATADYFQVRTEYLEGDASLTEGSFTVQGFSLTTDVVITAPTNFEISTTSGAGFANTINLTPASVPGDVPLTTIYVKLIPGLGFNTYNDDITVESTAVSTINVNTDGVVTAAIANCSELFISEYHEGISGPDERYIEIYNLSNLKAQVYIAEIGLTNGQVISKKAIKK